MRWGARRRQDITLLGGGSGRKCCGEGGWQSLLGEGEADETAVPFVLGTHTDTDWNLPSPSPLTRAKNPQNGHTQGSQSPRRPHTQQVTR